MKRTPDRWAMVLGGEAGCGLRICFPWVSEVVDNQGRRFEGVRSVVTDVAVLELVADENGRGGYYGKRGDILA